MTNEQCDRRARAAIQLSRVIIAITDEAEEGNGCERNEFLLLNGIIRDSAFKIERAATQWLTRSFATMKRS